MHFARECLTSFIFTSLAHTAVGLVADADADADVDVRAALPQGLLDLLIPRTPLTNIKLAVRNQSYLTVATIGLEKRALFVIVHNKIFISSQ